MHGDMLTDLGYTNDGLVRHGCYLGPTNLYRPSCECFGRLKSTLESAGTLVAEGSWFDAGDGFDCEAGRSGSEGHGQLGRQGERSFLWACLRNRPGRLAVMYPKGEALNTI